MSMIASEPITPPQSITKDIRVGHERDTVIKTKHLIKTKRLIKTKPVIKTKLFIKRKRDTVPI
jgi:bifunctional N-acetylglucosamine-1-phosphate-uridyltransferase/glucosamine-1-phosphate-acetyltransferase GlmU-like protein